MKRCCLFLLIVCLTCGADFSLFARENILLPIMDEPQNPERTQNGEEQDKTKIKLTENRLIIENLPEDGVLEIYNITGVKVYNRRVKAGTNQYILSLPKGYYIIKIGKLTRKIAIK